MERVLSEVAEISRFGVHVEPIVVDINCFRPFCLVLFKFSLNSWSNYASTVA